VTVRDLLAAEFRRSGLIPFERFMEVALYAPGCGYYTAPADPFGKAGDFYTAEQLQPVFGRLIAQYARARSAEMGEPSDFRFVEIGAGRRELAEFLEQWNYVGVDAGEEFPSGISGVVFAKEFFDALPVHLAVKRAGGFVEQYVSESLQLVDGPAVSGRLQAYLYRYHPDAPEGSIVEVNLRALDWICRIAASMRIGLFVIIDYGYTAREWVRHSQGTLMSYRRHRASEDVLSNPGEADITSHVAWTPLEDAAITSGWQRMSFESLASFLLHAGEADEFASALAASDEREATHHRLQLKTLLFGMGETFRVLTLRRDEQK